MEESTWTCLSQLFFPASLVPLQSDQSASVTQRSHSGAVEKKTMLLIESSANVASVLTHLVDIYRPGVVRADVTPGLAAG